MLINQDKKKQILKKVFHDDIEAFGQFFFGNHLKLETPSFHKEIYKLYESPLTRIAVAAPRGHAKSTITDLVFLSWNIVTKRRKFILLVSDTYSQAVLFLENIKNEFETNERLIEFYGNLKSTIKWSENQIILGDTMVLAIGSGMKVRGLKHKETRPDLVICDDLENDEIVLSRERRERFERWFNGALIPSMAKDARIIIIGTILHQASLMKRLVDPNEYKEFTKRIYKALNGGEALWPEHLNVEELHDIKKEYEEKGQLYLYYQEYMNEPVSEENRKFKKEKIRYFEEGLLVGKSLNSYITVDRAYSLAKTADFTGIIVTSVDEQNNWYIREAIRFKGLDNELIKFLFELHRQYKPLKVGIEQKAFEYTFKPTLDNAMRENNNFFIVEQLKDLGRNKALRIEGLLPRYESGSIYFKREQVSLVEELMMFPLAEHDDLSDALAYTLELAEKREKTSEAQNNFESISRYEPGQYIKQENYLNLPVTPVIESQGWESISIYEG